MGRQRSNRSPVESQRRCPHACFTPQRASAAPSTLPDVLRRAGTASGTKDGTGAQKWQHQSNGALLNPASGRCLDATGPSSANGTRLQIWDCAGSANQQWNLPS